MTIDAVPRRLPPRRNRRSVPERFEPVLAWLSSQSESLLDAADVELEGMWYQERPFSYVLRVAVHRAGSAVPDRHLFVKIFKCDSTPSDAQRIRQRVKKDYEQTVQIHQAMSRWPGLAAVRPVGYSLELLASVTEEAPGETLLAHLQSKAVWLATERHSNEPQDTMKRVGSWLRAFQSIGPRTGHVSVDSLRAYIDVRLERLTTLPAAHFNADDRRHVLAHLDRLSAIADPIDLEEVPVHRDLAPGNILVSPDCVTVLDFAMTGTGSRLHDLTRLFVQVELVGLKPQFSKAVLHRATRGLLEGFDEGLTTQRPMFRLLSLLHRVNHLATLSKSRAPFPASAYNWHVRRAHRSWIERELRMSERGA